MCFCGGCYEATQLEFMYFFFFLLSRMLPTVSPRITISHLMCCENSQMISLLHSCVCKSLFQTPGRASLLKTQERLQRCPSELSSVPGLAHCRKSLRWPSWCAASSEPGWPQPSLPPASLAASSHTDLRTAPRTPMPCSCLHTSAPLFLLLAGHPQNVLSVQMDPFRASFSAHSLPLSPYPHWFSLYYSSLS